MDTSDRMLKTPSCAKPTKVSVLRMRALNDQIAINYDCVLHQAPFHEMRPVRVGADVLPNLVHYETFLLPVADLRGPPATSAITYDGDCLVAQLKGRLIAIRVERIIDVLAVGRDQIREAPVIGSQAHGFLSGILRIQDTSILMVDLEALLDNEQRLGIPASG